MREFWDSYGVLLIEGTRDTLIMTMVSTALAYLLGLPMGVLFTVTKKGGLLQLRAFETLFGVVINTIRSLPFIILMMSLTPFTRMLVGTSIGTTAAIVPLVVAATPFVARMVESSLEEVDQGVVEAAMCMGASPMQIITKVLLVESVPSLLRGLSISIITILGYTAITGVLGAGGLGDIAFRYGHQRHKTEVMYACVVLLIILVNVVQAILGVAAKKADKRNR